MKHNRLQILELHWASDAAPHLDLPSLACGEHTTALRTLRLIDCQHYLSVLSWLLTFPKNLQYLTITSDTGQNDIDYNYLVDHGDWFRAIRDSGHSLLGLRFDLLHRGWVIVPAPGMHELKTIRYLEICEEHIQRDNAESNQEADHDSDEDSDEEYPSPKIECPLEFLLPPNLEVLKITPNASEPELLWEILERKEIYKDYLPHLRRIIICHHFRNEESANALRHAVQTHKSNSRNYNQAHSDNLKNWPLSDDIPNLNKVRRKAGTVNVEVVQLYKDMAWQEVLNEGAGPAVWEIPEQVAPLSANSFAIPKKIQQDASPSFKTRRRDAITTFRAMQQDETDSENDNVPESPTEKLSEEDIDRLIALPVWAE